MQVPAEGEGFSVVEPEDWENLKHYHGSAATPDLYVRFVLEDPPAPVAAAPSATAGVAAAPPEVVDATCNLDAAATKSVAAAAAVDVAHVGAELGAVDVRDGVGSHARPPAAAVATLQNGLAGELPLHVPRIHLSRIFPPKEGAADAAEESQAASVAAEAALPLAIPGTATPQPPAAAEDGIASAGPDGGRASAGSPPVPGIPAPGRVGTLSGCNAAASLSSPSPAVCAPPGDQARPLAVNGVPPAPSAFSLAPRTTANLNELASKRVEPARQPVDGQAASRSSHAACLVDDTPAVDAIQPPGCGDVEAVAATADGRKAGPPLGGDFPMMVGGGPAHSDQGGPPLLCFFIPSPGGSDQAGYL